MCARGQWLAAVNATRNASVQSRGYWWQENIVNIWNIHSVLGCGDKICLAIVHKEGLPKEKIGWASEMLRVCCPGKICPEGTSPPLQWLELLCGRDGEEKEVRAPLGLAQVAALLFNSLLLRIWPQACWTLCCKSLPFWGGGHQCWESILFGSFTSPATHSWISRITARSYKIILLQNGLTTILFLMVQFEMAYALCGLFHCYMLSNTTRRSFSRESIGSSFWTAPCLRISSNYYLLTVE